MLRRVKSLMEQLVDTASRFEVVSTVFPILVTPIDVATQNPLRIGIIFCYEGAASVFIRPDGDASVSTNIRLDPNNIEREYFIDKHKVLPMVRWSAISAVPGEQLTVIQILLTK